MANPVGGLSPFMAQPTDMLFQAMKRVLWYMRGTWNYGLMFGFNPEDRMKGVKTFTGADYKEFGIPRDKAVKLYTNADLAGNIKKSRSTSGVMLMMHGCPLMW